MIETLVSFYLTSDINYFLSLFQVGNLKFPVDFASLFTNKATTTIGKEIQKKWKNLKDCFARNLQFNEK
ncbi:unnamed protein product [Acanthoscelides obtectus]|uniref:Uncharacterized protein n=1 Tax=Acanthoscelides obtectus TaxID=200917 RepID=A0A9P0JSY9_ACAOB|nr:unnamed protein product [Acanthoscelides obtectus]CAK1663676.1 hypothetical protein AOBTE_LOCUS23793 [Acanthoscelides obtectus]